MSKENQRVFDLKALLKDRLINGMIRSCRRDDEYMLMLMDAFTTRVLNSCAKVSDCVEAGVTVLLPIASDRIEAVPMTAIYFLEPSEASVSHLVQDFTRKALYPAVHLFFTSPLDRALEEKIASCDLLMDRLQTLKIVNTEFVAKEQRLFMLNRPVALPALYTFGLAQHEALALYQREVDRTARQLAAMCASMGELPLVRFAARSKLTADIAMRLDSELELMRASVAASDDAAQWNPNRGVLLIADRSLDPVAPLMHEFTYQAAVYDLLQTKGDLVVSPGILQETNPKTKKKEDVPVVLDEYDTLWRRFRHHHIGLVGESVSIEFQNFLKENAAIVKLSSSRADDDNSEDNRVEQLKAMSKVGAALPAFEESRKRYTKHVNLSAMVLSMFSESHMHGKLRALAELEQDMATGVDSEGNKTKKVSLGQRLIEFISDPDIESSLKLRLIMIYLISQDGIDANTRTKIFKEAAISSEQSQAVLHLNNLGVTLQTSNQKAKGQRLRDEQLDMYATRAKDATMDLMRFVPLLSEVMLDLVQGKLSVSAKDGFPYVQNAPVKVPNYQTRVASSATPSAQRSGNFAAIQTRAQREAAKEEAKKAGASAVMKDEKKDDKGDVAFRDDGPKFMVYVAGGCTNSEVRCAYEIAEKFNCQMLIGANRVLTSNAFLNELMCKAEDENGNVTATDAEDVKIDVK